jgi:protein TonB
MQQRMEKLKHPLTKALVISLVLHVFLLLQNGPLNSPPENFLHLPPPLNAHLRTTTPPATTEATANQPSAFSTDVAEQTPISVANPAEESLFQKPPPAPPIQTKERDHRTDDAPDASTAVDALPDTLPMTHRPPPPSRLDEQRQSDAMRQYRINLAMAARRFRDYPAAARLAGIGGISRVHLSIDAEGRPVTVELDSSSGNSLLDAAALNMLGRAAQATATPPVLRGQAFDLSIPVEFDPRAE